MVTEEPNAAANVDMQAKHLEDLGKYEQAGQLHLEAALHFLRRGQIEQGITSLMCAARAYEKGETWRKIGALWDSTGEHIKSWLENSSLDTTTADSLYRHKVIGLPAWKDQKDLHHRAGWAFQWAAQHFEKEEGPLLASNLFSKAGAEAEQTSFRDKHRWAGILFEKAAVYSIRAIATQEAGATDFEMPLRKMEEHYGQIGVTDGRKRSDRYVYLLRGYRNIRLAFQVIGDSVKADEIRRKELQARQAYEMTSGRRFQGLMTWLAYHLWVLPMTWALSVLVIFPTIYWFANALVETGEKPLAWYDYVAFSTLVATTSGYGTMTPVASGTIIALVELLFSYALLALIVALLIQYFVRLRGGD